MADRFDHEVGALAGDVPIALLPVRIETRFVAGELRVRIFPDQIHVDAHETELTAGEREAGIAYWTARFGTPDPGDRDESPWRRLCGVLGPARAAWVAEALTPANVAQLGQPVGPDFPDTAVRPAEWSRAARAAALPERWLVVGLRRDGSELFRKWTEPVADRLDVTIDPSDDAPPGAGGGLPLQPAARWLTDFEIAEQAGMALRLDAGELASAGLAGNAEIDRLYVLGVDWTLAPGDGAAALGHVLRGHAFSDGLSAVVPGTPTNITAAARPGAPPAGDALADALDPERRPAAAAARAGTGGDRAWRALGLGTAGGDILAALPGAGRRDAQVAAHLAAALWESTLGLFLADFMTPAVSASQIQQVREHVLRHVTPGGPLPALRIGRQPYGVLPVVAPGRFTGDAFEAELARQLGILRGHWSQAVERAPRLGRTADLDADLTAVLQMTPLAETLRFRQVVGPLTTAATRGIEPHANAQERVADLLGQHFAWPRRPLLAGCTFLPPDKPLRVPLVEGGVVEPGAGLSRNYLREIAEIARTSGDYGTLKAREAAATLLESLVAHAIGRELHLLDRRTVELHLARLGRPVAAEVSLPEFVGIEPKPAPSQAGRAMATTPHELARVVIPALAGQRSVRQFVADTIRALPAVPPDGDPRDAITSLEWLADRPVDELERALRGLLDVCSHRLDAWLTSLATRRLASVREAMPEGVHIGAYGWVDNLRRDTGSATSDGYIQTPSLPQAATAAILRSGHLAHRGDGGGVLDLDLSSDRVRTALALLDGVAQGQPLAALLGYRFERALRERSSLLARFILPLRRLFPLRPDGGGPPDAPATPSEALAARDVVDGVALLERHRAGVDGLLAVLQPGPLGAEQGALAEELARLAAVYDAVCDLMVAESVHQNVVGNNERAGAVLAALDRQGIPPQLDFVRTPRSGKAYTQRVLVLVGDERLPAAWQAIAGEPRALAEPRLNAWIARLIGDPARVRFAAVATTGSATEELVVALPALGLGPLALVLAAHAVAEGAPSELELRVVERCAAQLAAPTADTTIELRDAPPSGAGPEIVGLGAFRALARRIHDLATQARAASAADLALPRDAAGDGFDDAELAARADAIARDFEDAIDALDRAQSEAQRRAALRRAAGFGVDDATPAIAADELAEQVGAVVATMRAALATQDALVTAFGDGGGRATATARAEHHRARIRALLGEEFPVLPRFTAGDPDALGAAHAAQGELLAGDALALSAWLARMGLVRPGTDRLAHVRSAAELLGADTDPADLVVAQLPGAAGDRWLGLPFDVKQGPAAAELALVTCQSGAVDFRRPLAGLFCDAWVESIPARDETTAIAFHHDAPGARAPQAVVLAVPPAAENPVWSVDAVLDTIVEAHELARIRTVGPRELHWLGTLLPALVLPQSLSKEAPAVDFADLAAKHAAANAGLATVLGKG